MEVMTLDAVAERLNSGSALTEADAQVILATHDLIAVATLADEVRRQRRGASTTFVRVLDVHADAVPSSLPAGVSAGEIRIAGDRSCEADALAAVRAVSTLAGKTPVTGFSLAQLASLAPSHASLARLCRELKDAGLSAVAEVAIDGIDQIDMLADAVRAARESGVSVLRMTFATLAEHQQLSIIERARALQEACGGFKAFAPLPRVMSASAPTTGYDDVKQVALARLMLPGIDSIQVDWSLYGPKLAQVALTMGADDVDAVAAFDVSNLGHRRSALEEIQRNIRAASLEPVERDALFRGITA
jgi:aminodeoxyfutalosine synthase